MTFDQLYEAIYDWVNAVVNEGSPASPIPIIQSHQNVAPPSTGDVYLVIGYTPTTVAREGWADHGDPDDDTEELSLKTDYEGMIDIREVNGTGQNLKLLSSSIMRQDFIDLMSEKGIFYRGEEPIQQIPRLQDNLWEKESLLEVRLGFAEEITYSPGIIEAAEVSGEIDGRDVVVSAPILYEQDFDIADGPVPDWTVIDSSPAGIEFNVVSNEGVFEIPLSGVTPRVEAVYDNGSEFEDISFGVQYKGAVNGITGILIIVRAQGVTGQGYFIWIRDVNTANPYIQSFDIDGNPFAPITLTVGDIFRVKVRGVDPAYIDVYQNDNLVISGQRTPSGGAPPRNMYPKGTVGLKVTGTSGIAGTATFDNLLVIQVTE